ncbi:23 kDa jasmonate-induced protein-like [Malania oleifera]|uniref:23 kDa jasmonate-induced protein-like n=1 Tax=Malania oleifera TaxID=397392 RepID=UPI0025AE7051|nr:23 kDa jasmonate-induced protein-like [Malania oleifera]
MAVECYTKVFPNIATNSYLKEGARVTPYKKSISTEKDDTSLKEYVEKLVKVLSKDDADFTVCRFHNETTGRRHFFRSRVLDVPPVPPPARDIAPGETLVFVHISTRGIGVVYRGRNKRGHRCDWMLSWCNQPSNKVYTEINEAGHYDNEAIWPLIFMKVHQSGSFSTSTWKGCVSTMTIEDKRGVAELYARMALTEQ